MNNTQLLAFVDAVNGVVHALADDIAWNAGESGASRELAPHLQRLHNITKEIKEYNG